MHPTPDPLIFLSFRSHFPSRSPSLHPSSLLSIVPLQLCSSYTVSENRICKASIYTLVVVVMALFQHQLLVCEIHSECTDSDSKTGESRLESVETRELALVSPGVSLGPGVAAHIDGVSSCEYELYSHWRSLAERSCGAHIWCKYRFS